MYRPLPKCLTIGPSQIDGLGVFATSSIDKETALGLTHIWIHVQGYHEQVIRTPLGGFINHSFDPNCYLVDNTNFGGSKYLYTQEDIREGEELTVEYDLYDPTSPASSSG